MPGLVYRIGGGGGGRPGDRGSRIAHGVPALGRRQHPPQYSAVTFVEVVKGQVLSCLLIKNQTDTSLTTTDNELGRFAATLLAGGSGTFKLHPEDYAAVMCDGGKGGDVAKSETLKTQSSIIIYMLGGKIFSTLCVQDSEHLIDEAVLNKNGQDVLRAVQHPNPELHDTRRVSTQVYETLLKDYPDKFQLFRKVTTQKDGTIKIDDPTQLSGRYTISEFTSTEYSLWQLLLGQKRLNKDVVLREEDVPFIPSENDGTDKLLAYVVLSKGEVIQCLTVEDRTNEPLSYFDTTLGQLLVARQKREDGKFLVNRADYISFMKANGHDVDTSNIATGDTQDTVIVYIEEGRIISTQHVQGSKHLIEDVILNNNDRNVTDWLGDSVFGGTWRISVGTYQALLQTHADQFQFFRRITRHQNGTVTVGEKIQLEGYQELSQYMGPVDELIGFFDATRRVRNIEKDYIIRCEHVEALTKLFPGKITIPT